MLSGREKSRMACSLLSNAAIVVCGAIGVYLHFVKFGFAMFQFYTLCSNVFALLTAAVCLYFNALCVLGLRRYVPSWARVLKYLSTCTLTLTLAVVLLILAPLAGGFGALRVLLFQGEMFYHHLLCPLLALISFVWVDSGGYGNGRRIVRLAVAPTALYAAVLIALNLIGAVNGPYPFLRVRAQPLFANVLWCAAILALADVLALLVWKLSARFGCREDDLPDSPPCEQDGYSADGYIKNQDCFSAYSYRTIPASSNGCGVIAAYNLRVYAKQQPELSAAFSELEKLHFLNVPGPTHMRPMRRYLAKYLPGFRETSGAASCLAAAQDSAMGLFRYQECRIPHFVSYVRTPEGAFRFFNVCDGAEDVCMPMERFVREHCVTGRVRLLYWTERCPAGQSNQKKAKQYAET